MQYFARYKNLEKCQKIKSCATSSSTQLSSYYYHKELFNVFNLVYVYSFKHLINMNYPMFLNSITSVISSNHYLNITYFTNLALKTT